MAISGLEVREVTRLVKVTQHPLVHLRVHVPKEHVLGPASHYMGTPFKAPVYTVLGWPLKPSEKYSET